MDRDGWHARTSELPGGSVGAMAGAGEDDGAAESRDDRRTQRDSVATLELPEVVGHFVEIGSGIPDLVTHRVLLVSLGELGHFAIERGGVQDRLLAASRLVEDAANCWHEPHVGHAVGFVEHDKLDLAKRDDTLADQVLKAPGGGDKEVHPFGQPVDLGLEANPAVDRQAMTVDGGEQWGQLAGDLTG